MSRRGSFVVTASVGSKQRDISPEKKGNSRPNSSRLVAKFRPDDSPDSLPGLKSLDLDLPSGLDVVRGFFESINSREFNSMLRLLSDDVQHVDLAHEEKQIGKLEVASFYRDLTLNMAPNMKFIIEDSTDSESSFGVTWTLAIEGAPLPLGRGLSFIRLNSAKEICAIRSSPEHFVKVAQQLKGLSSMASPILQLAGPAASPSFWSGMIEAASSAMASGQAPGVQDILGGVGIDLSSFFSQPSSSNVEFQRQYSPPQTSSVITTPFSSDAEVKAPRESLVKDGPVSKEALASALSAAASAAVVTVQPEVQEDITEPPAQVVEVNLTGLWQKDPNRSQQAEYERCLDIWQISGMQKATARLIEGLEIVHNGSKFNVHHCTIIPQFKVTEAYDLTKPSKVMRRDLRSGQATAIADMLPDGSGIVLDVSFGLPFPGKLKEVYKLVSPGEMHVTSTIYVGDQSAAVNQVYLLQTGLSKQELLKQSEKRNGSASQILSKFMN
jgi:hypothetical protein